MITRKLCKSKYILDSDFVSLAVVYPGHHLEGEGEIKKYLFRRTRISEVKESYLKFRSFEFQINYKYQTV